MCAREGGPGDKARVLYKLVEYCLQQLVSVVAENKHFRVMRSGEELATIELVMNQLYAESNLQYTCACYGQT